MPFFFREAFPVHHWVLAIPEYSKALLHDMYVEPFVLWLAAFKDNGFLKTIVSGSFYLELH